jgi:hypothetical protein
MDGSSRPRAASNALGLRSRIVTTAGVDTSRIRPELDAILEMDFSQEYSDFTFGGSWSSCVLWNPSGESDDAELRYYDAHAQPTRLARQLPLISDLAASLFDMEQVRWLRIFKLSRGLMLPHRDYLELEAPFTRLHLPLQTDLTCLHSEAAHVYHMRLGEIWFLDTDEVHSVCALGNTTRITLCFDFTSGVPLDRLVRAPLQARPDPLLVERPPLDAAAKARIAEMIERVDDESFRDVVGALSHVHFRYDVHAGAMYDWLVDTLGTAGKDELAERAEALRRFAIETRAPGERFFAVLAA